MEFRFGMACHGVTICYPIFFTGVCLFKNIRFMPKNIKKYKVGLESETYAVSLVTEPAIEEDFVHLAKQSEKMDIKLSSDERHICYGPALIPNKDIYRNNGEQEFYINFTEESIVKMSQDFMKNYRQKEVNLQHQEDVDEVFICESWLVEDPYKDKANALGFNVPKNTWMIGMKVNNVDTWERVKAGELKGFSVESAIRLEEFNKNSMDEINETFWQRMKGLLKEVFGQINEPEVNLVEENLEEQTPVINEEPASQEKPNDEVVETHVEEEVVETVEEPSKPDESGEEEPVEPEPNPLEDLVKNLQDELKALKEANAELQNKVKALGKKPSAKPVNTNAKPSAADTYAQWRSQMGKYINGGY